MSDVLSPAVPHFPAHREHRFECEGYLAANQRHALQFTFHVFADGALTIEISSAAQTRSADPLCYAYNGHAVPSTDQDAPGVFHCTFKLVRLWRHLLRVQFLDIQATLSPSAGLQGHYVVDNGDDDERPRPGGAAPPPAEPVALNLLPVSHKHDLLIAPMLPLTPGTYMFKGSSLATAGMVLECIVELQLHADGTLEGTHNILYMQQCTVRGNWTHDQVTYRLEFKIDESATYYVNTFTPSLGDLRGDWANEDPIHRLHPMQGGHIELQVHSAVRVWSPEFHKMYPRVFQQVAKLLLLQAVRSPAQSAIALPSVIWQLVLSFCDFHHFLPQEVTTTI